jgi:hypothetical protein
VPTPTSEAYPAGAFAPFAIWGGNPGGLTAYQQYNFWGSQWDSQVTGGNYDTTARFKGFIDTAPLFPTPGTVVTDSTLATLAASLGACPPPTATPAPGNLPTATPIPVTSDSSCWSTGPGNSNHADEPPNFTSPPYNGRPLYLDVLVSTYIIKSGNTDYGNIAAVVKMRVDNPDQYMSSPGNPGYGTILCPPVWDPQGILQGC